MNNIYKVYIHVHVLTASSNFQVIQSTAVHSNITQLRGEKDENICSILEFFTKAQGWAKNLNLGIGSLHELDFELTSPHPVFNWNDRRRYSLNNNSEMNFQSHNREILCLFGQTLY